MQWLATLPRQGSDIAHAAGGAEWPRVSVGHVSLWHSRPAPARGVRRVDVPGCGLVVLGCCSSTDSELELIARRVSGGQFEALAEVEGSRTVLAVRDREVVALGDIAGQHPVFYAQTADGNVVVGSDCHMVATAVSSAPRVDRDWVALHLLMPTTPDVWGDGTPWLEVHAVRPGQLLHVGSDHAPRVAAGVPLPAPECDISEAAEAVRAALWRAVSTRTAAASRPTTDLSGGMDSSTVAALAADASDSALPAITISASGSDDRAAASAVAASRQHLTHTELDLPGSAALGWSDLDQYPIGDEPATHLASAYSRARWWLTRVAETGSDLHFSGEGGDNVLQAPPAYLADLARPTRMATLWQHATGWAQLRTQPPLPLITAATRLQRTSHAQALREAARRLCTPDQRRSFRWSELVSWFGQTHTQAWATPDARRRVAARLDHHAENSPDGPRTPARGGTGDAVGLLALQWGARSERQYTRLAAQLGVNHHSPFLDEGVVRACWSLPAWRRTDPRVLKPLLRAGFGDVVPRQALHRSTKGNVTGLVYDGLARNAASLQELFRGSRLGDLGVIQDGQVCAELQRGAAGLRVRMAGLDAVVSTELWLRGVVS